MDWYTVILDWGGDMGACDAPVIAIEAADSYDAWQGAVEQAVQAWNTANPNQEPVSEDDLYLVAVFETDITGLRVRGGATGK